MKKFIVLILLFFSYNSVNADLIYPKPIQFEIPIQHQIEANKSTNPFYKHIKENYYDYIDSYDSEKLNNALHLIYFHYMQHYENVPLYKNIYLAIGQVINEVLASRI